MIVYKRNAEDLATWFVFTQNERQQLAEYFDWARFVFERLLPEVEPRTTVTLRQQAIRTVETFWGVIRQSRVRNGESILPWEIQASLEHEFMNLNTPRFASITGATLENAVGLIDRPCLVGVVNDISRVVCEMIPSSDTYADALDDRFPHRYSPGVNSAYARDIFHALIYYLGTTQTQAIRTCSSTTADRLWNLICTNTYCMRLVGQTRPTQVDMAEFNTTTKKLIANLAASRRGITPGLVEKVIRGGL